MTKKLLQLNHLNKNNRMYTHNVVQEALIEYQGLLAYIEREMSSRSQVNLENVIGVVSNMRIDEGCLVGDVEIFSLCSEKMEMMVKNDQLSIRPFGMGMIDEHRAVQDYKLVGFAVTDDPS